MSLTICLFLCPQCTALHSSRNYQTLGVKETIQICILYFTKILKEYFNLKIFLSQFQSSTFLLLFQDLRGEIEKIVKFLGKELTNEQLTKLTEHLRFDNFSKNEAVNLEIGKELGFMNQNGNFIRKVKKGIQSFLCFIIVSNLCNVLG